MINVKFDYTDKGDSLILILTGHAGADEIGKDLICASASMLTYTLAQCVMDMYEQGQLKKKPKVDLKEGDVVITAKPKKEFYSEALHTFFIIQKGMELLAYNYPKYVSLEMFKGESL